MTAIYMTTYDAKTKQATGPSVPSGFNSIEEVRQVMGAPGGEGVRCITYPEAGLCYSEMEIAR